MEIYSNAARIPPNHPESEKGVLGSMLTSADATLLAIESLMPEDFYDPANREIFEAMLTLSATGSAIDIISVDAELSRRGKLDTVGGIDYLMELSSGLASSSNIHSYIRIVNEKSTLRKLIAASETLLNDCYSTDKDIGDVLNIAERLIYDITMKRGGEELQPIQPVLISTFERIEHLYKTKGRIDGVETGYRDLDDTLTGLHGGELVLIAARPSMGKTSIGMNFVENAAIRTGKKCAVFSLEMPAQQIAMRMLCTEALVDMQNVRKGNLNEDDWTKLSDAMIRIGQSEIYIDATPGITVAEMRSKSRRLQLEKGLDLILIDYISLMTSESTFGSRQEEVASISRSLKALAIELNVPVIALQQLSRAPTGRSNHRPVLSDIRESGAIEQDADVVMFLHREDYYNPDTPEKNIAELIIAKQRNGALGTVKLGWQGQYTKFIDLSKSPNAAI